MECQRQLNKVGLEQSLIRVLKTKKTDSEYPSFNIDMDPRVNKLDTLKIKKICPTDVFEISEEDINEF